MALDLRKEINNVTFPNVYLKTLAENQKLSFPDNIIITFCDFF